MKNQIATLKKVSSSRGVSTLKCYFRLGLPSFACSQYSKQDPLICGNKTDCIQGLVDQVLQPICL